MLKDKRSNIKHGRYSRALVLPAVLEKGDKSTLVADRLVLVDPRGEISEEDLLEFLEKYVEPNFWPWLKKKQKETFVSRTEVCEGSPEKALPAIRDYQGNRDGEVKPWKLRS